MGLIDFLDVSNQLFCSLIITTTHNVSKCVGQFKGDNTFSAQNQRCHRLFSKLEIQHFYLVYNTRYKQYQSSSVL